MSPLTRAARRSVAAWVASLVGGGAAAAVAPSEYEVKAAFIHNFGGFVEWPPKAEASDGERRLCVAGSNPFGTALDGLQGRPVDGRRWSVTVLRDPTDVRGCHVLFISSSETGELGRILEKAREAGALTVGDTAGYAERGVVINFFLEGQKVRFEINVDAAQRAGLRLSSQLLKLAHIVHPSGARGG